jgi:uncharacterized protein YjbI with pentapeptide repeats
MELNAADFSDTNLKGIDLSSCYFEQINLDPTLAKGLSIRHDQATAIVAILGINIQ